MSNKTRTTRTQRTGASALAIAVAGLTGSGAAGADALAIAPTPLLETGQGKPPNVLLIPDTSESMQESIDGRLARDTNPDCTLLEDDDFLGLDEFEGAPGESDCFGVAGARHPLSKASIVKRVGLQLVDEFRGNINLGLLSYQQMPAAVERGAFDSGGTVMWRQTERLVDFRSAIVSGEEPTPAQDPDFYQPDHDEEWNAPQKRFAVPHPDAEAGETDQLWLFFNDGIPGFWWDFDIAEDQIPSGIESDVPFWGSFTGNMGVSSGGVETAQHQLYWDLAWPVPTGGVDSEGDFQNFFSTSNVLFVDSLRQRNLDHWGDQLASIPTGQLEWRSTEAPGLGYLHVPIGGLDDGGTIDAEHWEAIKKKLQPQRHDWDPPGTDNPEIQGTPWEHASVDNPMTHPEWPLIAAGLTPLEGAMLTARDYFLGRTEYFGSEQGNRNDLPDIPESCDVNAVVWVTDGLPSATADGEGITTDTSFDDTLQNAASSIQTLYDDTEDAFGEAVRTHIVGFALPPGVQDITEFEEPLDILAEAGGTDSAWDATDEDALDRAMAEIFRDIVEEATGSAAAAATNTTSLQDGAATFQASYDTGDWSGNIEAFALSDPQDPEGNGELRGETPDWVAEERLPSHGTRNIFTWVPDEDGDPNEGETLEFHTDQFDDFTDRQQEALNQSDGRGLERLNWLRGNQDQEGGDEEDFRVRNNLIGDIVQSEPIVVYGQDFGYERLDGADGSYQSALEGWEDTDPKLFVAANDGKLHAFDARVPCDAGANSTGVPCGNGGTELFSVIPNSAYEGMAERPAQNFGRDYVLDGSPQLGHVQDGNQWRRVVVTTQGRGGSGVFAVDVDNREVLWEIDDSDSDLLGVTIGDPVLGRTPDGDWVTIIPNGPNSSDGRAGLVVVDSISGEILGEITPENGDNPEGNGMFAPVPVDVEADQTIDRLYAGDLEGNLWRVDLDNSDPSNWSSDLLFQTHGGSDQPITSRPAVARGPSGSIGVYFGTGRFFATGDDVAPEEDPTQSLYGIFDNGTGTVSELREQEIIWEDEQHGFELRSSTERPLDDGHEGWYLDLLSPANGPEGERVVERPIVRGGDRVVFATLIPETHDDPCQAGNGTGWIMELDAFTGSRLQRSPWDVSGDGFGEESFVDTEEGSVPPSGIRSPVGAPSTPSVVEPGPEAPDQTREYKQVSGSDGIIWEMPDEDRAGFSDRVWRQIQ